MDSRRVALVTGASSGIGAAAAEGFLAAGFETYVAARRTDRMTELGEHGARVIALDVTDEESMAACVKQILAEQGRIDVLVNNAGYGSFGAVEDVPVEEAKRQFDVNLFGLARLTQLVLPAMREQGSGRIINVSSVGGRFYEPFGAWYHATKYAVEGLSNSLRIELSPFGIKVVLVAPAAVRSEWVDIAGDSLLEHSGSSAYGPYAERAVKMIKQAYDPATSVGPEVVGRAIVKAATRKRPPAVVPVGKGARTIRASVNYVPTPVFDEVLRRMFGTR